MGAMLANTFLVGGCVCKNSAEEARWEQRQGSLHSIPSYTACEGQVSRPLSYLLSRPGSLSAHLHIVWPQNASKTGMYHHACRKAQFINIFFECVCEREWCCLLLFVLFIDWF